MSEVIKLCWRRIMYFGWWKQRYQKFSQLFHSISNQTKITSIWTRQQNRFFRPLKCLKRRKQTDFLFYRNPYDMNVIIPTNINHLRTQKMSAFMQCFKDLKKVTIINIWQTEQNIKLNINGISAKLSITWYIQIKQRIFYTTTMEDKGKSTSVFLAAKFKSKRTFAISVIFTNFLCFE